MCIHRQPSVQHHAFKDRNPNDFSNLMARSLQVVKDGKTTGLGMGAVRKIMLVTFILTVYGSIQSQSKSKN